MKLNTKPIRICAISYYYSPEYSGSAVQARNLIRFLKEAGVETFVVTANHNNLRTVENVEGSLVHRIPVVKRENMRIFSFWISLAWFLVKKRKDYDIIHAHGTFQHGIASIVGKFLGKKTILKIAMANSDIAFHRQGRIFGKINNYFVKNFDAYIATSKDIVKEIIDSNLDSKKIVHIPNGVDTKINTPIEIIDEKIALKVKLGLPEWPLISFVGIINQRKNIDFILSCGLELKKKKITAHLLLIGPFEESDTYYQSLLQFIGKEGLTDFVSFLGFKPSVTEYLQASDIFFFPSKQEGMPNVLLEAMACGLPCLTSKISGTEDLVQHQTTGYLFPLEREDLFMEVLCDLARDTTKGRNVGSAAREFIVKNFSLYKISNDYVELYRKLSLGDLD